MPAIEDKKIPTAGLRTHAGPHWDLSRYFEFFEGDDGDDEMIGEPRYGDIVAFADICRLALEAPTSEERLAAVDKVISNLPQSGLSYAVLAREKDCDDAARAELYKKAVECFIREHELQDAPLGSINTIISAGDSNSDSGSGALPVNDEIKDAADYIRKVPYEFLDECVTTIVAEAAEVLMRLGESDQLTAWLDSVCARSGDQADSIKILKLCHLIRSSRLEEAQATFDELLEFEACYFLIALLLFRKDGDSPASRGCLQEGLQFYSDVCERILSQDSTDDAGPDENEWLHQAIAACWQQVPGAVEWLDEFMKSKHWITSQERMDPRRIEDAHKRRLKIWKDNYYIAETQQDRGNFKLAKRDARTAYKEACLLPISFPAVYESLMQLSEIAFQSKESNAEVMSLAEEYLQAHRRNVAADRSLLYMFVMMAKFFTKARALDQTTILLTEALELAEKLLLEEDKSLSLWEVARIADELGIARGEQRRFGEAIPALRRAVELREKFLRQDNSSLLETKTHLMKCFHQEGSHTEELQLRRQILEAEPEWFTYDSHAAHGKECAWKITGCTSEAAV